MLKADLLSRLYKLTRGSVIKGRPLEDAIEIGDKLIAKLYPRFRKVAFHFPIPKGIEAHLYDLIFPSPLTIASFKDDWTQLSLWLDMGMGGGLLKTIMSEPRAGNPKPRIEEIILDGKKAIINAMGLPGKGIVGFISQLQQYNLGASGKPIGISIGGSSLTEYHENLKRMDAYMSKKKVAYFLEINISCPNTPDGQDMLKHPELLHTLLTEFRRCSKTIVGVKLSPDQSNDDLIKMACITKETDRTYVNLGNTRYQKSERISIGGGGVSGPPLFPRTLEMTQCIAPLGIPIIATGGVSTTEQVMTLLASGATLIGMAAQLVFDPYQIPKINKVLAQV